MRSYSARIIEAISFRSFGIALCLALATGLLAGYALSFAFILAGNVIYDMVILLLSPAIYVDFFIVKRAPFADESMYATLARIAVTHLAYMWILVIAVHALRRRENNQEPGFCAECGYDLTGNTSGVCPECGTPIATKTTMKQP